MSETTQTLRDYFASNIIGHLMNKHNMYANGVVGTNSYEYHLARDAYKIADAMLAEREKCNE